MAYRTVDAQSEEKREEANGHDGAQDRAAVENNRINGECQSWTSLENAIQCNTSPMRDHTHVGESDESSEHARKTRYYRK
ncbi:unnamed protein product [Protopolystoma xenopodis]|uniref:Uncharacterized protein n=1 Tax=Protopolystoma xenopodis TaxID=117903 RepID=A0A3S5FDL0_9PLAT|nr:unnamed protein product [Protopolystoma xenopodis]